MAGGNDHSIGRSTPKIPATYIGNNNPNNNTNSQQDQYGIGGDDRLAPSNNDKSYFLYGGNGDDELLGF